ncbi:12894_t:CDS:2 [Gigaspora margarita]|uniref:12894_t:CDS:1 n=1 Tax=Gigaspora margarita TaxID=4874 RepID=A0ABN7VHR3_GIGMA|nr:12894_t:CDS:2 [Gigaspora margarita]
MPAPYTYNINMLQNVYSVQPIPRKQTQKRLLKKPLCPQYRREFHPILKCPEEAHIVESLHKRTVVSKKEKCSQKRLNEKSEEEIIKMDKNKVPNIYSKFVEDGNLDNIDKNERIGVRKDEKKYE